MVIAGSVAGSVIGAIVAITKLVPERARIIVGYQGEVIDDLRAEMERLKSDHQEEIERLERRIGTLENRVEELEPA